MPNKLSNIVGNTFGRVDVEEIQIPESVKGIGNATFAGCKIKEIKLSKNLTKIHNNSFWFCEDLESVEMSGVIILGDLCI